jgi:hypothetical protein
MKCLRNTNFVWEVQNNLQGLIFFVSDTKLHYTAYIYSYDPLGGHKRLDLLIHKKYNNQNNFLTDYLNFLLVVVLNRTIGATLELRNA